MAGQKMGTVRRNSFLTGVSSQEAEEPEKGAGRGGSFESGTDTDCQVQRKTQTGMGLKQWT